MTELTKEKKIGVFDKKAGIKLEEANSYWNSEHCQRIGFLAADISRLFRQLVMEKLVGGELSFPRARLLVHVERFPGIRQAELAKMLEMPLGQLVKISDRLIDEKYLDRKRDDKDRRAYRLYLAGNSESFLKIYNQILDELGQNAVRGLSKKEIAQLKKSLAKVRENLAVEYERMPEFK